MKIFKEFHQFPPVLTSRFTLDRPIRLTDHSVVSGSSGDVWEGFCCEKLVTSKALHVQKGDGARKAKKVTHLVFPIRLSMRTWGQPPSPILLAPAKITTAVGRLEEHQHLNAAEVITLWAWTVGL